MAITTPVTRANIQRQFFEDREFWSVGVMPELRDQVDEIYAYEVGGAKACTVWARCHYIGNDASGKAGYAIDEVGRIHVPTRPARHFRYGAP